LSTAGLEVDESALVGLVHAGTLWETEKSVEITTDAVLAVAANSKTVADDDGEDLVLANQLELLQELELLDLVEESDGLSESGVGKSVDVEDTADAHQVESALDLPGEVELKLTVTAVLTIAAVFTVVLAAILAVVLAVVLAVPAVLTVVLAAILTIATVLAVTLILIHRGRDDGSVASGRSLKAGGLDGGRSLNNGSLDGGRSLNNRSLDGGRGLDNGRSGGGLADGRLSGGNLGNLGFLLFLGLGCLDGSLGHRNGATKNTQATTLGTSAGNSQSRRQADSEKENVDRLHDDDVDGSDVKVVKDEKRFKRKDESLRE
jgi:hypothetical protein